VKFADPACVTHRPSARRGPTKKRHEMSVARNSGGLRHSSKSANGLKRAPAMGFLQKYSVFRNHSIPPIARTAIAAPGARQSSLVVEAASRTCRNAAGLCRGNLGHLLKPLEASSSLRHPSSSPVIPYTDRQLVVLVPVKPASFPFLPTSAPSSRLGQVRAISFHESNRSSGGFADGAVSWKLSPINLSSLIRPDCTSAGQVTA